MSPDPQKVIQELSADLLRHQYLYYIKHKPEITDYEFDQGLAKLKALEEAYPHLALANSPTRLIGSDLSEDFIKYKHSTPVLSLNNSYSLEEVLRWARKAAKDSDLAASFHVQWKIDGASLILYYDKGRFVRAVTRGDGREGDEVNSNALTIRSILPTLHKTWDLCVRGEVFMSYEDFAAYNESHGSIYANPRNLAAGSLKHKKSSEVARRPLSWVAYDAVYTIDKKGKRGPKQAFLRETENLQALKELGLPLDKESGSCSLQELPECIEAFRSKKDAVPYPVDGLVIKLDHLPSRERLGATASAPRWAIAYKFQAEEALSRVEEIESFVGRTGRVTPRARLEAVQLAGTTVRYATLHNADFVQKLGLRVGSKVKVSKRGEIIPAIEEVVEQGNGPPFLFPSNCPACSTPLIREAQGVDWLCTNKHCPAMALNRIIFFCGRKQMNIADMGVANCHLLFEKGFLSSVSDIYHLHKYQKDLEALPGFGPKSLSRLLEGIEASKKQSFQVLLYSLGLREIGPEISRLLIDAGYDSLWKIRAFVQEARPEQSLRKLEGLGDQAIKEIMAGFEAEAKKQKTQKYAMQIKQEYQEKLEKASYKSHAQIHRLLRSSYAHEKLLGIHGIGTKTAKAIIEHFQDPAVLQLCSELEKAGLSLSCKSNKNEAKGYTQIFTGQSWCITGVFSHFASRNLIEKEIRSRGGKTVSTVSGATSRLLCGAKPGSKLQKAAALGIEIIEEEAFVQLLESSGLGTTEQQ